MKLSVEIWSDVICPWCYIGQRRLEQARWLLAGRHELEVAWLPFELNPEMPPQGVDRRAYRSAKFGSWERSQELGASTVQAGAQDGVRFDYARMTRTPNTLDAHRLIWLAGSDQLQDAVVARLFRGYFLEARDVGDRSVLAPIGAEAGLDRTAVMRALIGQDGIAEVRHEQQRAHAVGLSGVPFLLFEGRWAVSGAQPPETLVQVVDEVASKLERL